MSFLGRVRSRLKTGFEQTLRAMPAALLAPEGMRGRRLVLAYHGLRPSGESPAGERVLHLQEARFCEQLEALGDLTQVVPLAQLLAADPVDEPRPRVAITWDDAYAGAVTLGVEAVVSRGMAATIFVSPGRLGGHAFWWDRVAMQSGGSIPEPTRDRMLTAFAGDEERIVQECPSIPSADELPAWVRSADQEMLTLAASRPGITVASHSWNHPNLNALAQEGLDQELHRPLQWLRERFSGFKPWLSLPYGLGSPTVRERAESAGYAAVFNVHGGWFPDQNVEPTSLPRLNIPAGLSTDGFVLRLRGLFCG